MLSLLYFRGKVVFLSPVSLFTIRHGDEVTVNVLNLKGLSYQRYDKDVSRTGVRLEFLRW